jgi:hypothetical protein
VWLISHGKSCGAISINFENAPAKEWGGVQLRIAQLRRGGKKLRRLRWFFPPLGSVTD